jgi:hypothetical protein
MLKRPCIQRNIDQEGSAAFFRAIHADTPAMVFRDRAYIGQIDAPAAFLIVFGRLCPLKDLKNTFNLVGPNGIAFIISESFSLTVVNKKLKTEFVFRKFFQEWRSNTNQYLNAGIG